MVETSKNIVLVGAGYANVALASLLEKSLAQMEGYNLILISARDYAYHLVASLRANVSDEKVAEAICIPLDRLFKDTARSKIIHGEVIEVKADRVLLRSGQEMEFAYLVLATGARWLAPSNVPDVRTAAIDQMKAYRDRIAAAKDIVIVGGGATGVELAGEIAGAYPKSSGKNVTLVHKRPKLLNDTYSDKFRLSLQSQLACLGVDLYLEDCREGEFEHAEGHQEVTTTKGEKLQPDLIVKLPAGVKVKPTFQIEGHDKIFAIGDLADLPERKLAIYGKHHAAVVDANIIASIKGLPVTEYQGSIDMAMVNISTTGGAGYLTLPWIGTLTLGPWLTKNLKGRALNVGKARAALGY